MKMLRFFGGFIGSWVFRFREDFGEILEEQNFNKNMDNKDYIYEVFDSNKNFGGLEQSYLLCLINF